MKIQFDGQQQYQLDAVNAIADLFDGQPLANGQFEINVSLDFGGTMTEMGFGNQLKLSPTEILANIKTIQERNEIEVITSEKDTFLEQGLNFSVEMETGTGKTYVYLRTIHELNLLLLFQVFPFEKES
jgi:type III restriction enzyme